MDLDPRLNNPESNRRDPDHQHQFLSVRDLADRYGLTPATVYAWLHNGRAPRSLKIGRRRMFRLTDVLSWEQECEQA